jgi:hypothetical protein
LRERVHRGGSLGSLKKISIPAVASTIKEFNPIQAKDIDAELERSLTHEWDARITTYPNERFPFNEWILNRIHMMGYDLDALDNLHEVVPQKETFKVTKQLCADTNLPEFRRMVNRFVREVAVPKGKLRPPIAV